MAYRIEYGSAVPPQYVKKTKTLRLQIMTAVCLLTFSILVRQYFPTGTQKLRQLLLPGKLTVTQEALDGLMGDLRNGEPLTDAFTAFCEYIIDHDETIIH